MSKNKNKFEILPQLASVVVRNKDRTPRHTKAMIKDINAGKLTELIFPCITYIDGSNTNSYRFYSADLEDFAASFVTVPFLYDHNTRSVMARHGTVIKSELLNNEFHQEIKLTTPESMLHFLRGNIDRFSIGWYHSGIDCSICNSDWFQCNHWQGRKYTKNGEEYTCELYFVKPRGKEVSAVNAPAVRGTGTLGSVEDVNHLGEIMNENDQETNLAVQPPDSQPNNPPSSATTNGSDWLDLTLSMLSPERSNAVGAILRSMPNPTPEFARTVINSINQVSVVHPSELTQAPRVTGHSPVTSGHIVPQDRFLNAWVHHFGGQPEDIVPRYARDIRQLYQDMTGDVNWRGIVDTEHSLAAASNINLPSVVADALNRVLVPLWGAMTMYQWYYPIVRVAPNDGSLQAMKWITLGGISNLPVVAEGAAYTEATLADSKEEDEFKKYGVYVGITMEMIRNSLVMQIQEIPRLIALAAHRTRSAAVASIFTSNSGVGPTLEQDSKALFHADHANLATTAFSHDAWASLRTSMFNQPELGSGKPIAVWPRYCLLPVNLYDSAREVFGYGSGSEGKVQSGSGRAVNPFGQSMDGDPRPVPIVVPDFTDSNNWAGVADPMLHPTIYMSYGQQQSGGAHPMPEIFSAVSPTVGLSFTNDTLAVKVRDFVSIGVSGYRGIAKRNVA